MAGAGARHGPDGEHHDGDGRGTGTGAAPDDAGLYPTFVARLREAGLDPDVEQLRDALWLARWAHHPDAPPADAEGQEYIPAVHLPRSARTGGPTPSPPTPRPTQ